MKAEVILDEESVKEERDRRLKESDFYMLPDVMPYDKGAIIEYRQKLRDLSSQKGYPHKVVWPSLEV